MFFTQPKINRFGLRLQSSIAEICHDRWALFLGEVSVPQVIAGQYLNHLDKPINAEEIAQTWSWFREKEHFQTLTPFEDGIPQYRLENARKQYQFYAKLLNEAKSINAELCKKKPDYNKIIASAHVIQNASTKVPSIRNGKGITVTIEGKGESLGNDLLFGIAGIGHVLVMLLAEVIGIIPYCMSYSKYCGGPRFFLDTVVHFCESIRKIAFSLLFPLNMLYSAYTTGSYNSITKGEIERCIESIISLAEKELDIGEKPQAEDLWDVAIPHG